MLLGIWDLAADMASRSTNNTDSAQNLKFVDFMPINWYFVLLYVQFISMVRRGRGIARMQCMSISLPTHTLG